MKYPSHDQTCELNFIDNDRLNVFQVFLCSPPLDKVESRVCIGRGVEEIMFPHIGPPTGRRNTVTFQLFSPKEQVGTASVTFHWEKEVDPNGLLSLYTPCDPFEIVREMKKQTKSKWIGLAKAKMGFTPKYPIVIVPGV